MRGKASGSLGTREGEAAVCLSCHLSAQRATRLLSKGQHHPCLLASSDRNMSEVCVAEGRMAPSWVRW